MPATTGGIYLLSKLRPFFNTNVKTAVLPQLSVVFEYVNVFYVIVIYPRHDWQRFLFICILFRY